MHGLTVSLLGSGRIELDGQALTRLLAPKHQALIFVLAAEGRALPRQRLAELLWGDLEETAARGNLRGALTRLRRWLPEILCVDGQQVGFADPAGVEVDLLRLQHAQQDGALSHDARVAAACAWRGPLLEGFDVGVAEAFESWLATTRRRADQAISALRHDLLTRAESAGQTEEAIAHARALLDIDDADETAHMALMRLLATTGRRTAAIAQYEACRAALAERLGARPSAACYALYTHIHADAMGQRQPAPPAPDPPPIETSAVSPPPTPAPEIPLAAPLVGRTRELALIAKRLADPACRWLTLVGPGGVGKTRLALAAAAELGASKRHGVLVLSGRDDAAGGGVLRDGQALVQTVIARIGSDRHAPGALLLVLDNLETVPESRRFEPLLRECAPGVTVLATSRMRVGGGREWLVELQGLSLDRTDPDRPASSPAAALLEAAAQRLSAQFCAATEADAVERICALVGGLPLALEMAGRGVHTAGAAAVAERIAAGVPLADDDRDDGDHHHSIDTVMQDSWALLDAPVQAAVLRLAQLPSAFDPLLAQAAGAPIESLPALRERAWLSRIDAPAPRPGQPEAATQTSWLALHPLQQAWLRRQASPDTADDVAETLHRAFEPVLPVVSPFDDLELDTPLAPLAARAVTVPQVLAMATRHACANDTEDVLARWIDGAVALLHRCALYAEAAALIAEALQRNDLSLWRRSGWMLRRVEMLEGDGQGMLAQTERRAALVAMGLPDVALEDAGWFDVLRARFALSRFWTSLSPGATRDAIGAVLVRQCIFNANALNFLPDPGPALRAGALADAACGVTHAPASLRWVGRAWAGASMGHPTLARYCAHKSRELRCPPMPPRNRALLDSGHDLMRVILGEWNGLAASLDAVIAQYHRIGVGRQEMEMRSLGAKLAFYEGRLTEAWDRFAQMSELGLQRPGETWRAWGPIGLCEVGLCLPDTDDALLQRLLERATQMLSEMENLDASYVLRRHGVAARLAWRRGDVDAASQAVQAGAASAARTGLFGFWAHEGLSALGDVLAQLCLHGSGSGQGWMRTAWATLDPVLVAHLRRFPPAAAMCARVRGLQALTVQRRTEALRLLNRSVTLAERQGALVDQARALEALALLNGDESASAPTAEQAGRLWRAMAGLP